MLWIRSAQADDAQLLGELHAASWRSAYRDVLSDAFLAGDVVADRRRLWADRLAQPAAGEHVFIAGIGSEALGFAAMRGDHDAQWGSFLNNLHVLPAHQRQGMGTRLLRACAGICATQYRHAGLYLWVTRTNARAQAFYLQHGAQNQGQGSWQSPEGKEVGLYRFVWPQVAQLWQRCALPDG